LTLSELQARYEETGTEGFNIAGHYGQLLQLGRSLGCRFYAGFLPRRFAREFMVTGDALTRAVDAAVQQELILPECRRLKVRGGWARCPP
jgi:hypothetical protein